MIYLCLKQKWDLENYLRNDHILVSSRRHGPGLEDYELIRFGFRREVKLRVQHYFAAAKVAKKAQIKYIDLGSKSPKKNPVFIC